LATHIASAATFYHPSSTGQGADKQSAPNKDVTVFGFKIHYLSGASPDVVLLHGLEATRQLTFNINALAAVFTLSFQIN
jgi:hypothetical protein